MFLNIEQKNTDVVHIQHPKTT